MAEVMRGGVGAAGSDVEIIESAAKRVSWGAIFGGVVMAAAVQMLLALLGLGVGFTTIDPQQGGSPSASAFGIGAAIWWTVSNLVAMFIGGYVAARLAGLVQPRDGVLHGLITWAFSLLLTFFLLSSAAGAIIGGAFNALHTVTQGAAQSAQPGGALTMSADQVGQGIDRLVAGQTDASPDQVAQARSQLVGLMPQMMRGGEDARQAREEAVRIVAQVRGVPPQQVEAEVNQALAQAEQKTTEVADKAANAVSAGAITAFIALLLGAIVAGFGGHRGTRIEEEDLALRL